MGKKELIGWRKKERQETFGAQINGDRKTVLTALKTTLKTIPKNATYVLISIKVKYYTKQKQEIEKK